jgi:hypothetical protein
VTEENRSPLSARLRVLTTPVAYLTQLPRMFFRTGRKPISRRETRKPIIYFLETTATPESNGAVPPHSDSAKWRLVSAGPDCVQECGAVIYDTTNGTKSRGDSC